MSDSLQYTSSIKDMPLMFSEMRRTAILLGEGKADEEIIALSMSGNIYQLEREKRRRDVPLRMLNRLSTLSEPLINIIADGSESDAKLIAFLALIKADRLFYEYMREVYAGIFQVGKGEIDDKDFIDFIERKAQESNVVAGWTGNNRVRIRNTYKNVLCEAGLAKRNGPTSLLIQKPFLDADLLALFDGENVPYAKAMLLEV